MMRTVAARSLRPPTGVPLRWSSTEAVSLSTSDGVAVLAMQKPPVNSMDPDFCRSILTAVSAAESDPAVRALVLTSNQKVFTAGLDLQVFARADLAELDRLWHDGVQELFRTLWSSRLATAAAINGHAPAGGCFLSLLCDVRVMAAGFRIGLNETALGIAPPFYFCEAYAGAFHSRAAAERAVQTGAMMTTEAAHKAGVIDVVSASPADVVADARKALRPFLAVDDAARHVSKLTMRQPLLDRFNAARAEDLENFVRTITAPTTQATLHKYLASLKAK
eukprot:TRINITY_DN13965_c0_g1_i1.p1 TRINITY_DN13965_c0_g1~~TRINITY_DN13965_c0_g1_i1.p1  ORF type:complete len:278 (-),score=54.00 TRINITY_DN13965_c0_g1_i1:135-968(-)